MDEELFKDTAYYDDADAYQDDASDFDNDNAQDDPDFYKARSPKKKRRKPSRRIGGAAASGFEFVSDLDLDEEEATADELVEVEQIDFEVSSGKKPRRENTKNLVEKKKKKISLGLCGFFTSSLPRSNGSHLERCLRRGEGPATDRQIAISKAANDNFRWPLSEECKAKRISERSQQAIEYIADVWNRVTDTSECYLTPGAARSVPGADKVGTPDLSKLCGQEQYVHATHLWDKVEKETFDKVNGRSRLEIVLKALRDRCEMRDLAPDVRNKEHRAKVGRERLIEALPIVAEAIRLLDVQDAA